MHWRIATDTHLNCCSLRTSVSNSWKSIFNSFWILLTCSMPTICRMICARNAFVLLVLSVLLSVDIRTKHGNNGRSSSSVHFARLAGDRFCIAVNARELTANILCVMVALHTLHTLQFYLCWWNNRHLNEFGNTDTVEGNELLLLLLEKNRIRWKLFRIVRLGCDFTRSQNQNNECKWMEWGIVVTFAKVYWLQRCIKRTNHTHKRHSHSHVHTQTYTHTFTHPQSQRKRVCYSNALCVYVTITYSVTLALCICIAFDISWAKRLQFVFFYFLCFFFFFFFGQLLLL